VIDRPAFDALMTAIRDDTVAEYLKANPDTGDTLGNVVS